MHTLETASFAHLPATLRLGDLEVRRLGFGAMRLPGKDVWGEPTDPEQARAVLRRAVELGVNLIDTSWYYGPLVANRLIRETLHPYPRDLVIACKLGGRRHPDKSWGPFIRPEELRQGCEEDLTSLGLDRLDVVHLRYMKTEVPFLESLDALIALQREGKIRHLALSNVDATQVELALARTPLVAIQNLFNVDGGSGRLARQSHAEVDHPVRVLSLCEKYGLAYLPFFPLAVGGLQKGHPALEAAAERHGASLAQVAIAWLLARSPVMLPIPGTSSLPHLEENWTARTIELSPEEVEAIGAPAARAE